MVAGQCAVSHCGPMRHWPRATHTDQVRPLVLSEYAHAMGNSSGNLDEWWGAFYSMKHAQGGFLWVDQGLAACNERGRDSVSLTVVTLARSCTTRNSVPMRCFPRTGHHTCRVADQARTTARRACAQLVARDRAAGQALAARLMHRRARWRGDGGGDQSV